MKKEQSSDKGKGRKKRKYRKPAFTKHGKLGRMVVAMSVAG